MNGYFLNFMVYTLAMIGIMMVSVVLYKKMSFFNKIGGNENSMKIEESLSLSPKKMLYVVSVEGERFLIASDADRTTFLAKLDEVEKKRNPRTYLPEQIQKQEEPVKNIIPGINPLEIKRAAAAKKNVAQKTFTQTMAEQAQKPVMRSLAGKIQLKRGV